jgi:aminoglycoside phosphotransferase (APT) family kinase protein
MSSRAGIYYWKCDRAAALHGTSLAAEARDAPAVARKLEQMLRAPLRIDALAVRPAGGQGNHLTFTAHAGAQSWFLRVEDGPEGDDYMEVESALLTALRPLGVPVPQVLYSDATRANSPFAVQVLEHVRAPDLNQAFKSGHLDLEAALARIGGAVAQWQALPVRRFGPFDIAALRAGRGFVGLHAHADDYYFLNFERHCEYLVQHRFLDTREAADLHALARRHQPLLRDTAPCLVHKDLALWNVLGDASTDRSGGHLVFIDWDDAVGGDAMDDFSLLACFHPAAAVRAAIAAYSQKKPLPADHAARFWLHLLRNMLLKAVIRVGAGYFERNDNLFLLGAGGGAGLKAFTLARLRAAADALREGRGTIDYE